MEFKGVILSSKILFKMTGFYFNRVFTGRNGPKALKQGDTRAIDVLFRLLISLNVELLKSLPLFVS